MDPMQVLTAFGPLIATTLGGIVGVHIWRSLGRIEGGERAREARLDKQDQEIERHENEIERRLDRQDAEIERYESELARLRGLPDQLERMRLASAGEHAALREKIDELSLRWQESCRECLLQQLGKK